MSSMAALLQLAAELTLFLVALAGAGLSARNGLLGLDRAAGVLLVGGFIVLVACGVPGRIAHPRPDR
ncbi:MAG: hypothetical protein ACR2JF_07255 [Iamia sp.]